MTSATEMLWRWASRAVLRTGRVARLEAGRSATLRRSMVLASLAVGATVPSIPALALDYPVQPIRLIVAYPPGGATDPVARVIAERVGTELGQPLVVENKPGAAGAIATEYVAHARPDGYTLLFQTSALTIEPNLHKDAGYDPTKDLASVTIPVVAPFIMEVSPDVPASDLKVFIAYAKAHPGKVKFGSAGLGSSTQLAAELFMQATGTKLTHIPYKGSGPVITALLANEVQVYFDGVAGSGKFLKSGQFKPLGIAASRRSPDFPDVPTFAEQGVDNANSGFWMGMFAPAGTPKPIIDTLSAAVTKALSETDVAAKIALLGGEIVASDPTKASQQVDREVKTWSGVMKAAGIEPK